MLNSPILKLHWIHNACLLAWYIQCLTSVTSKLILRELRYWLPLRQRIHFKILNNMGPSYLSSLLSVATLSRYSPLSCCDGTLLRFPPMKSWKTLGNRAFMFTAPKLWNSLLHDIRTTTSLSCFKIKLKKKNYFLNFFLWLGF